MAAFLCSKVFKRSCSIPRPPINDSIDEKRSRNIVCGCAGLAMSRGTVPRTGAPICSMKVQKTLRYTTTADHRLDGREVARSIFRKYTRPVIRRGTVEGQALSRARQCSKDLAPYHDRRSRLGPTSEALPTLPIVAEPHWRLDRPCRHLMSHIRSSRTL